VFSVQGCREPAEEGEREEGEREDGRPLRSDDGRLKAEGIEQRAEGCVQSSVFRVQAGQRTMEDGRSLRFMHTRHRWRQRRPGLEAFRALTLFSLSYFLISIVHRPSEAIVPRPSAAVVHRPSAAVVPHHSAAVVHRPSAAVVPRPSAAIVPHPSAAVVHRPSAAVVLYGWTPGICPTHTIPPNPPLDIISLS